MSKIAPSELILVIIALLFLFGGKKIPELMKGLGQGIKEFKDATKRENNQQQHASEKSE